MGGLVTEDQPTTLTQSQPPDTSSTEPPSIATSYSTALGLPVDPHTQRIQEALSWLRAQLAHDTGTQTYLDSLSPTPNVLRTIETARIAIEAAEASRTARPRTSTTPPALRPPRTHALAAATASLGLREDAGHGAARASAAAQLSSTLLHARTSRARAHAALSRAQSDARSAARQLADARGSARALRDGAEARARNGAGDWDRVAIFDAKRAEYADGAAGAKRNVRASGVDTTCTHDALEGKAEEVEGLRDRLATDQQAVATYRGLPPVRSTRARARGEGTG